MGKHTLFDPPFGRLMRWLGGVPVDRRGRQNLVEQAARSIREAPAMCLAVAPSGTRERRDHWKSGFYRIAEAADVPIVCAFLDYGRKVGGLGPSFRPSGDVKADMDLIRAFYTPIEGRVPANKSDIRLPIEDDASADAEVG
jgi:1-acyl-sn-glycerol-3-phosphate acyltransferase